MSNPEWSLHEMEAISVGLEPAIADLVRHRRPLTGIGEKEAAIIQLGREIGRHRVAAETYARTLKLFGKTDMVDMVDLMSNYAGTGVNLTAANQWMPPQMKQFLPLPFTMPNDILPDSRSRIPVVNPARPPPGQRRRRRRRQHRPVSAHAGAAADRTGFDGQVRRRPQVARSEPGQSVDCPGSLDHGAAARPAVRLDDDRTRGAAGTACPPAAIDAVRNNTPATSLRAKEAVLIQFGRELLGQHNVTAETYARARTTFGQQDLSDFVVNVIAPHTREAVILTVFDQQLPAGQPPLLSRETDAANPAAPPSSPRTWQPAQTERR